MSGKMQKAKLSLRTAFRIGTHGMLAQPLRLIIVVFLATAALTMFGLSVTVALYDEDNAAVQSIYEYDDGITVLKTDEDGEFLPFTQAELDRATAETGKAFGTVCYGEYLPQWYRFVPYVTGLTAGDYAVSMRNDPQSVCYVTQAVLDDAGFTLTGRLPQSRTEIVINGCMLETFLRAGYYDDIASPQYWGENRLVYDQSCIYAVKSAQELVDLGIKMYLTDPETQEDTLATVVGVVEYGECPNGHSGLEDEPSFGLYDQLYVSEEFFFAAVRENYGEGAVGVAAVAGRAASTAEAKAVFEYCRSNGYLLYSDSINSLAEYREPIAACAATFVGVGAAFAVFAVLLIFQFVSLSIESKKLQVGILRALGARSKDVVKIFLSESLFLALLYAVLAIPLTAVLSKAANAVLKNQFRISVSVLNFHWLMPLFVFVLSIGITLIAVLFPVVRLARKSPVDCIRDCA